MNMEEKLVSLLGKKIANATKEELYLALLKLVDEKMKERPTTRGNKKLYYISAEFLIGRQLGKNLINLGLDKEVRSLLEENGKDLTEVEECEKEPSLGNGGLGRLAACFLDSIATLNMPGDGIGLRYHLGLFKQEFVDHKQKEVPDHWLDGEHNIYKTDVSFPIELAGKTYYSRMYDLPVMGYEKGHNTLHLFDLDTIDESIVKEGISFDKTDIARNLTLFLYPDDSDENGRLLRIYQQYFMVSNAAQLILQEEKKLGHNLYDLAKHVAIQINDTHPSLVIPELIRLLVKENIPFLQATQIVRETCAYTNHTILAEALEKWPIEYLNKVVPHLVPIIGGLDFGVSCALPNQDQLRIIDHENRVHMAHMDMHFGHSINGVAALHTEILKHQELQPFYYLYPERFNNKTNGITFRRWIMHCNPELSQFLDEAIGTGWRYDARQLESLIQYYDNEDVLQRLEDIKYNNKIRLCNYIAKHEDVQLDPNSIVCTLVKRMHEYKRQQMDALYIIYKYRMIKAGARPNRPITILFGGKAAPAYTMAKNVIHLILCLQELIKNDPEVSPWLKVVMVKNYNISKAEIIIPASEVSEQISLASKEASGTGNMKFMLNGAVTLGTRDGANVEIGDLVGHNNIYTFGRSSDEVINLYNTNGYHAIDYYRNSQTTHEVIDFITGPELRKIGDLQLLKDLQDNLIYKDWFMTLLDFESYCVTKEAMFDDYENRAKWKRMMLVNIAKAGFFSSDRTIHEYNNDIWHLPQE